MGEIRERELSNWPQVQVVAFWVICGGVSTAILFGTGHWVLAVSTITVASVAFVSGVKINQCVVESKELYLKSEDTERIERDTPVELMNDESFWVSLVPRGWLVINGVSGAICLISLITAIILLF